MKPVQQVFSLLISEAHLVSRKSNSGSVWFGSSSAKGGDDTKVSELSGSRETKLDDLRRRAWIRADW